ncbi:hypothetical protein RJ639_001216 [Escallonia herrerae]|uniref:Uncharacterized protein n=1 Tax=Escallonia herrerae TaxID=1293975 RepID=A0AA88XAF9_9ASTE|nr:hypothetical protein RJ639_001216 [Escallonia herrerae]
MALPGKRYHYQVLGLGLDCTPRDLLRLSPACPPAPPEQARPVRRLPRRGHSVNGANANGSMDVDPPSSERQSVPSNADLNKPVFGNLTYDDVITGKFSSQKWKQVEKRKKKEEREKKKKEEKKEKENIPKSSTKLQKITNHKTLKSLPSPSSASSRSFA